MKPALVIIFLILLLVSGIILLKNLSALLPDFGGISVKDDGGIFKSEDAGESWVQLAAKREKEKVKISGFNIYDIEISPQNSQVIFAGTNVGLIRTVDSGQSWQKLPREILGADSKIFSIAIDPKNPNNIYLASYFANRGKILKSEDNGETFKEVFVTYADRITVSQVEVDSYNPSIIFAVTSDGLFLQSKNSGLSWQILKDFREPIKKFVVNQKDTREIYLSLEDGRLFKTLDKGLTWHDLTPNLEKLFSVQEIGKIREIMIDPISPNLIYFGTELKFLRSFDNGKNFEEIESLVVGEKYLISTILIDPSDTSKIYVGGGSQIYKSVDSGKSWIVKKLPTQRKVTILKIDPNNSSVIYAGLSK